MQHEAPSAEEIAKALGGRRSGAGGWMAKCPAHDDTNPSLSINEGENGKPIFHCHTKCSQAAVLAALKERGLWQSKTNGYANGHSKTPEERKERKQLDTYDYFDEAGRLVFQVVRYAPKDFRQRRKGQDGEWIPNVKDVRQVPYRLPELAEAIAKDQTVFVVEGEKDCKSLAALSIVATCNAGGAGKWKNVHSVHLKEADVVILPDNDEKGRKHAEDVANSLQGIARRVRVLELPDLPDKGDISDWISAGGTAERLWEIVGQAPDWQGNKRSDIIWGVPLGEETQRWLVDQLLPETGIGLLSGQWGTFKTFVGMDLSAAILTGGTFAGRKIVRPGGVLWLAAEGQSQVPVRLQALKTKYNLAVEQFAWTRSCPLLTDDGASEALLALCHEAKQEYRKRHDLPLSLVIIDTIGAAAGWEDENSAAEAQGVMRMLASIAHDVGICIAGIDHFGKLADTGTRGASPKEDFSDFVIALLGEREPSGGIKNSRVALRKLRGGQSGTVIPFTATTVQLDDNNTSCVIAWQEGPVPQKQKDKWPGSLQIFRTSLGNALASNSQSFKPSHDSAQMTAADLEHVRHEFYALYAVADDGTEKQKQDARQKAFKRALRYAQERQLIGAANHGGAQFVWLVQDRT